MCKAFSNSVHTLESSPVGPMLSPVESGKLQNFPSSFDYCQFRLSTFSENLGKSTFDVNFLYVSF